MRDYFANTFTVNPTTTVTDLPIGSIATAKTLWIRTDKPIQVTLTQNAIDKDFEITDFIMVNATYTQLQLANASATDPAHVAVVAIGDRVTNPGTPGIW